jgi:TonB family protein
MSASGMPPDISLAGFSRGHRAAPVPLSSRIAAGALTLALYALLVFLATHHTLWVGANHPERSELIAKLMPDLPRKKAVQTVPPFLAHLIRPHAETVAPPVFTVASEAPVAPATLSASAATSSPLAGGVPAGNGATGQSASANGSGGNGTTLSSCWDQEWAKAVREKIRHYFYYPSRAAHQHVTGVVVVHMLIRRTGRLDLLEIGKSSGDASLDEAATKMVRDAQPLPQIPDRMHADKVDAEMPIIFGSFGPFKATAGSCN